MASTDPVALLRETLERYLEEAPLDFTVDADGDFAVPRGSAVTWIRPVEWTDGQTIVRIWSITNVGMRVDGELTRFLAVESGKLVYGGLSLDESRPSVHLGHTLLGDFLSRQELEDAVHAIASTADVYDELIEARFGGRRFTQSLGTPAAGDVGASPRRTYEAVFGVLGILAGIAAAVAAYYWIADSFALAIFAFLLAAQLVGRGLGDVISDPRKVRRTLYFLLGPALSTAILYGVYLLWERWWLAAVVGFVGGVILSRLLALFLFPQIDREEQEDTARRFAGT
jgi:hypothetical protein